MSSKESIIQTPTPRENLEKFVTRVWEHPLVDEKTRRHREAAIPKLEIALREYGIDPSTFITIPVGALLWAVDEQSDFDYQCITATSEDAARIKSLMQTREIADFFLKNKINIVLDFPHPVTEYLNTGHISTHANLLFTPDRYLHGNLDLASNTRLRMVNHLITDGNTPERWDFFIKSGFEMFFQRWDQRSFYLSWMFRGPKDDVRERTQRIKERLDQRAAQTHNPDKYKEMFEKARYEMPFPDFETYRQAITETEGALHMSPRYAVTGIK